MDKLKSVKTEGLGERKGTASQFAENSYLSRIRLRQGLKSLCENWQLQVPPLRYPGFPVEFGGVDQVRAPFFAESRIRGPV